METKHATPAATRSLVFVFVSDLDSSISRHRHSPVPAVPLTLLIRRSDPSNLCASHLMSPTLQRPGGTEETKPVRALRRYNQRRRYRGRVSAPTYFQYNTEQRRLPLPAD
ncbi:hypothetical protein BHE74_00023828 [Ensete ventricosum]|uniref:Uncharacterized protein n=1 Tax=Ensete ventricosum TaxID=4639 RepID=A0A427A2M0_ENSVE|nr:hypothetical protein B296_00023264 [Ensete ventricosum]RWW68644.1 hypothetical protein BHE74_00023828 [Ensete ventricosum]